MCPEILDSHRRGPRRRGGSLHESRIIVRASVSAVIVPHSACSGTSLAGKRLPIQLHGGGVPHSREMPRFYQNFFSSKRSSCLSWQRFFGGKDVFDFPVFITFLWAQTCRLKEEKGAQRAWWTGADRKVGISTRSPDGQHVQGYLTRNKQPLRRTPQ